MLHQDYLLQWTAAIIHVLYYHKPQNAGARFNGNTSLQSSNVKIKIKTKIRSFGYILLCKIILKLTTKQDDIMKRAVGG